MLLTAYSKTFTLNLAHHHSRQAR